MMQYTELLELLKSRRSIREFTARPVDRDTILRILEAARWAPSNHNRQPWKFIVLQDTAAIRDLAECVREHLSAKLKALPSIPAEYASEMVEYATFFADAPVLIVVLHKRPISAAASVLEGVANPALVSGEALSVAMAVQNLLLAAHALGLGTCVLTGPLLVDKVVMEKLKIPAGLDLNCLVALGYSDVKLEPPRRKDLQQILEFH
jgi:nitroreductase